MSLRLRLTLLYSGLLLAALLALGVTLNIIVAKRLYDGVDETLNERADDVSRDLGTITEPLTPERIDAARPDLDDHVFADGGFRAMAPDGTILYSSFRSGRIRTADLRSGQGLTPRFSTAKVGQQRLRVLYSPLVRDDRVLASIQVGKPLDSTDDALEELRYVFILGGLAVLAVGNGMAYWLAGRAIRPVGQVAQLARDIEATGDFGRRLAARRSKDEAAELVETFNAMIGRVQATLDSQRAFLADSSHELRRPLTVIRANLDLLGDDAGLPPEERAASLEELQGEAEAMSGLVSDLLLLAREDHYSMDHSLVDLSQMCQETAIRLRNQDERHEVSTDIQPGVAVVGDKERLSQMLWNVVENAAQYTPDGGRIAVTLSAEAGEARIEVRDNGPGIAETDLPQVFQRFFRGDQARLRRPSGTGLGLAIVKHIAEAHTGAVSIASQPAGGASVVIVLPLGQGLASSNGSS